MRSVSLYSSAMWGVFCPQLQQHKNPYWNREDLGMARKCKELYFFLLFFFGIADCTWRSNAEKHQKRLLYLRNLERGKNWVFEASLFQGFTLGQAPDAAPLSLS